MLNIRPAAARRRALPFCPRRGIIALPSWRADVNTTAQAAHSRAARRIGHSRRTSPARKHYA